MKRTALAVGLALAAPAALALDPEVNLSGTFGLSLSSYDYAGQTLSRTDTDLENNASNFRITAAAQDVGIRAFIAYERGASNDRSTTEGGSAEDVREFFGGVSGAWGMVVAGRKASDYRIAGERLDPFYNTSVAGYNGQFASEGGGYGLSNLTNGYVPNTVAVRSASLWGFTANAATYISDQDSSTGDRADYGGGLGFANSEWLGLDAGVQVLDINNPVPVVSTAPGPGRAWRAHASLGANLWAAGVSYEILDVEAEADPRRYLFIAGSWQLLEPLRLAASYGRVDRMRADTGFNGNGGTVGAFYDLMRNLSVYAAARVVALDNAEQARTTTFATGAKFVFDVDL